MPMQIVSSKYSRIFVDYRSTIPIFSDLTVKLNGKEIYREQQNTVVNNEVQSTNFSEYFPAGDFPVGNILRIDFKPEVRAAIREVFINYRNVLC